MRISFCFLISFIFFSCQQNRQVIPYDENADEIYKPLAPNDSPDSMGLTFGKENIPGFIFDYEMSTDNQEIFVFFQNLTVLDINPAVTQDIFEFIQKQLCEYGFINDSVSLQPDEFKNLVSSGMTYAEASAKILDIQKQEFEAQFSILATYNSPFNIYFNIYPVYIDNNFVTYWESAYSYTGGAHGVTNSYMKTYDLLSGKFLNIEDIVKPERLSEVREEVVAHMAYSYPIYENISTVEQYIDSLNVWLEHFSPEDAKDEITIKNFPLADPAITKDGLVFMYQMYELTPGSDGCPLVFIPYKDIKGCLKVAI